MEVVLVTPINVVVMEVLDLSMIFLEKVVIMPVAAEVEQEILLVVVDMVEMVAVVMVVKLKKLMVRKAGIYGTGGGGGGGESLQRR